MSAALALAVPARPPADEVSADHAGEPTGFAWIAERLDRALAGLGRLAAMLEALPADAAGREVAEAEVGLRALGGDAAALAEGIAARRSAAKALAAVLKRASSPIDDLARGIRTVGIVAVNARVVAAGVLRSGEGLELFTSDVAEMAAEATAVLDRMAATHRGLGEDLRRLERQWTAVEAEQAGPLARIAERIGSALDAASGERAAAAAIGAGWGAGARRTSARLTAAAPILGIGETARRRMERMQAMSGLSEDFIRQHEAHIGPDLRAALLDAVCRLQAAQIEGTLDTFARETAEAEARLRAIAGEVDALAAQAAPLAAARSKGAGRSLHAALEDAAAASRSALQACAARMDGLAGAEAQACAAADGLLADVAAIGAIQESLRLLSLNASVRCAQLGAEGRVLNVIAGQLRDLTAEIAAAAQGAAAALAGAAGPLATLREGGAPGSGALAGMEAALATLRSAERRLDAALSILAEAGGRVARLLGEAAEAVADQPRIVGALLAARARVLALCAPVPPAFAGQGRQAAEALFAVLRRRLPSEAERAAHDAAAAQVLDEGTPEGEDALVPSLTLV